MRTEAEIVPFVQRGFVGPALATRYPIEQVVDPTLRSALVLWREVAPSGVLVRAEHSLEAVLTDPRLNSARATVIQMIGPDPLDWPIVYHGWGFADWRAGNRPPAYRVGDLPWPAIARATAAAYPDLIAQAVPMVHRISLFDDGHAVVYDRLALPCSHCPGDPVGMIVTVSVDLLSR
jgi:hypothetical protein